jgi:hypothetical protein
MRSKIRKIPQHQEKNGNFLWADIQDNSSVSGGAGKIPQPQEKPGQGEAGKIPENSSTPAEAGKIPIGRLSGQLRNIPLSQEKPRKFRGPRRSRENSAAPGGAGKGRSWENSGKFLSSRR